MSRPQVTITLGRSGQVVKRPGSSATDHSHSDYPPPSSGSKRSIRDRLGNVGDKTFSNGSSSSHKNKRQRRDGNRRSSASDDVDGARVNPNDLRYKLMRKNMSRRTWSDGEEQNSRDLREKLSRTAQPPVRPDTRQVRPDTRQVRPDTRQMRSDTRQHMPATKDTDLLRRIPPTRSADDLLQMDSLRKSYSAWTLDGVRRRSPDRNMGTSRGFSPPRNMNTLRHVSSVRPVDATRATPYMSKDILDGSRPSSFMPKTSGPLDTGKPVVRLPPTSAPPSSAPGTAPKISYMSEEPLTVANLLHSLGLGKYAILFQAEEVDMTALKQMSDHDLKELGIPMGPRKKILLAVASHSKRPPRVL